MMAVERMMEAVVEERSHGEVLPINFVASCPLVHL